MKKLIFSLAIIAVAAVIVVMLKGCGGNDGGGEDGEKGSIAKELTSSKTYDIVEGKAPEGGYYIYLDASGSMPGYFKGGLTDYIKLVSGLQGGHEDSKVYFWGDETREVVDLNSTITNGNYKGKASLFQNIFKTMADKVRAEDVLAFLVTDGIVSNASSVTNKRTGYTISDLPLLPAKIKDALGDSMAVAVFRCEIPFNGTYWDIDNKTEPINAKRPIFVISIGYPAAIADLRTSIMNKEKEMENFTSMSPKQLYMGIFSKVENQNPFRDIEGDRFSTIFDSDTSKKAEKIILSPGVSDFSIAVNVPTWIKDMGADPVEKHGVFTIVNGNHTLGVNKSYNKGVMKFMTIVNDSIDFNLGVYKVDYNIVYRPSDTWNGYSCDDDRAIETDTTLLNKTFGLKEILRGFELATQQPDTLFSSSFKFEKE